MGFILNLKCEYTWNKLKKEAKLMFEEKNDILNGWSDEGKYKTIIRSWSTSRP